MTLSSYPDELMRDRIDPAAAGLVEASPDDAGYTRRRHGKGWVFLDDNGQRLDEERKTYCASLAVPPAWSEVWFNPDRDGHILARGVDDAGRRQYIYHPDYRAAREAAKFADMSLFAERLPRLRRSVKRVLDESDDQKEITIAHLIVLLDRIGLRIGSFRNRAESGTVGATTLRKRHVHIDEDQVTLTFTAKGGKKRSICVQDEQVRSIFKKLVDRKGADLFRLDGTPIRARHVNAAIEEYSGHAFTAKDFRTWGGSVSACHALRSVDKITIKSVSEHAAEFLGNTPAIARNSYIHPNIIDLARRGERPSKKAGPTRLRVAERYCFAAITT